jgi:hypothetical protein
MVNSNSKLTYLKSKFADLESNKQKLEQRIRAVLPHDILTKDALEKQLYLVIEEIMQKEQEIRVEENNFNNQLLQRKFDRLVEILQSSGGCV